MRISGGSARGRNVRISKAFTKEGASGDLRPTSGKVRKAVFDILQDKILSSRFVDLYAGSGAVGLEALSRGAGQVTFVESSSLRMGLIRDLSGRFGFGDRVRLVRDSAHRFLQACAAASEREDAGGGYDIIFADPPYGSDEVERMLSLIGGQRILKKGGILIVEHPSKKTLPADAGTLSLMKAYRYGDSSLTFYRACGTVPPTRIPEVTHGDT